MLKIAHAGESRDEPRAAARGARPSRAARAGPRPAAAGPGARRRDDRRGRSDPRASATGRDFSPSCPAELWSEVAARRRPRAPLLESLGATLGAIDRGLSDFGSPAARRDLKWDLRRAGWIRDYLHHIEGAGRRALVERWLADFDRRVRPALEELRQGVIYNDANDNNIVVHAALRGIAPSAVAGVIDFGDLCLSNVVCEPAIAAAYAAMGLPDPVAGIARLLAGYHAAWPSTEAELEVVHALVCMRLCVSVTNSAYQATVEPENRYLTISERARLGAPRDALGRRSPAWRSTATAPPAACRRIPTRRGSSPGCAPIASGSHRSSSPISPPSRRVRSTPTGASAARSSVRPPSARTSRRGRRASSGAYARPGAVRRDRRLRRSTAGLRERDLPPSRQRSRRVADRPSWPGHLHACGNAGASPPSTASSTASPTTPRRSITARASCSSTASRTRPGRAVFPHALRSPERGSRSWGSSRVQAVPQGRTARDPGRLSDQRQLAAASASADWFSTCSTVAATSSAPACPRSARSG